MTAEELACTHESHMLLSCTEHKEPLSIEDDYIQGVDCVTKCTAVLLMTNMFLYKRTTSLALLFTNQQNTRAQPSRFKARGKCVN